MGVVVSETTSETPMATESVTANSRKRRPTMPPMSRMGMKTATSEVDIERTVKPISLEPTMAASNGLQALLEVAGDVLDDDDGVVDDEAGGDGERHEGEIVQRVAEQVHHAEGAEQRERNGDRRDERRAAFAKEDEDDEDHEQDGDDERARDVVDRGADGAGAVEHDLQS